MTTPDPNAAPAPGAAPAAPPAAPAPGAAPAAPPAWHADPVYDTETRGWLENRGLTKLEAGAALPEVIKGFRNAEKFIGAPPEQIIRVPKDDTPEAWNQVYDRLGRPKDPKGYDIPVPDGQDKAYSEWARGTFHELGLNAKQAKGLTEKWNAYVAEKTGAMQTEYKNSVATDAAALQKEWGAAHEKNLQVAKGAAREFGMTAEVIDSLEKAMGFAGVMKLMHSIGSKLGEDKFIQGGGGGGFGDVMSPEAAKAAIEALKKDPEFSVKYIKGDAEARAKMSRLHQYAYPGEQTRA